MHVNSLVVFCMFLNYPDNRQRVFYSIESFQNNSITFDASQSDSKGNYVVLKTEGIENLGVNTLKTFQAFFIRKLKLRDNNIQNIDDGAFDPVHCIKQLELQHNNISHITNRTFSKLGALQLLYLNHNNLMEIPDNAFADSYYLEQLYLSNNKIAILNRYSFCNLTKLYVLDLSYNRLTMIHPETFHVNRDLSYLNFAFNRFTNLEIHTFNLRELAHLDLAGNYLDKLDFDHVFAFEFSLDSLDLSYNDLTQLNPVQLKGAIRVLSELDLSGNPWYCHELWYIVSILEKARVKCVGQNISTTNVRGIDCLRLYAIDEAQKKHPIIETTSVKRISIVNCVIYCLTISVVVVYIVFHLSRRKLGNFCKSLKAVDNENVDLENPEDNDSHVQLIGF